MGSHWRITLHPTSRERGGYACVKPNTFGIDAKQGFVAKQAATTHVELTLPATAIGKTTRIRFSIAGDPEQPTDNANTSRKVTDFGWRIDDVRFEPNGDSVEARPTPFRAVSSTPPSGRVAKRVPMACR